MFQRFFLLHIKRGYESFPAWLLLDYWRKPGRGISGFENPTFVFKKEAPVGFKIALKKYIIAPRFTYSRASALISENEMSSTVRYINWKTPSV